MRKAFLQIVKATFPAATAILLTQAVAAQQNVIANKDNTRPELMEQAYGVARVNDFKVSRNGDYNLVQWSALADENTRRFIVEYSEDGTRYQSAGDVIIANQAAYAYKHTPRTDRSLLYRLRMETADGKQYYTGAWMLEGRDVPPVRIYPTVVEGNTVNVQADFPAERAAIVSSDGKPVYTQELGGVSGYQRIITPSLPKGMYMMTFYGRGWQSTSKFVVAR